MIFWSMMPSAAMSLMLFKTQVGKKPHPTFLSTCRLLRKDLGQDSTNVKPKLWKWKRLVPAALAPDFSSVFYFFPTFSSWEVLSNGLICCPTCLNRSETEQLIYWAMQIQSPTHPNGIPKGSLICWGQEGCHPSILPTESHGDISRQPRAGLGADQGAVPTWVLN